MLEAARAGRASSLLIRGEPGMGKSALLSDTAACASGFRVLRTAGLEAESALAFAALHRLLRPGLDRMDALPAPQRRALRVAFGEEEGDRLDPVMVAVGTLSLLTELGESAPVLRAVTTTTTSSRRPPTSSPTVGWASWTPSSPTCCD